MSDDPRWPRAASLLQRDLGSADVAIVGIPTYATSISPTQAHTTPPAIRQALTRFSTYASGSDVSSLNIVDIGDVVDPDGPEGEARVAERVSSCAAELLIGLGGDNSLTYAMAKARWGSAMGTAGLVTLDAHHDVRDGISNGSPVRRLIEAGLDPVRIAQIGIADFANSPQYAQDVHAWGITVIPRSALRSMTMAAAMQQALDIAGAAGGPIHVDIDVDVCDQSVAPACPAAAPGGISADDLRVAARIAGADSRVTSVDIVEIDAARDTPDGRTVRLAALCVLEVIAGFGLRH